jgi:hypothetical protein
MTSAAAPRNARRSVGTRATHHGTRAATYTQAQQHKQVYNARLPQRAPPTASARLQRRRHHDRPSSEMGSAQLLALRPAPACSMTRAARPSTGQMVPEDPTKAVTRTMAQHKHDPGRTRTCNPRLRRPMPYPLGHGAC